MHRASSLAVRVFMLVEVVLVLRRSRSAVKDVVHRGNEIDYLAM